jgi:hypothetical protein
MRRRLVLIVQQVMLRTRRGRLGPFWRFAHAAVARGAALYLRGADRRAAVYMRTSLGVGDPVYGVSDIDLTVVLPGSPNSGAADRMRVKIRRRRLHRVLPAPRLLLEIRVEEELDVHAVSAASVLTHGLDGRAAAPVYRPAPAAASRPRLQERPGLYGPLNDWRLLLGPELRPGKREWAPAERSIASWLELQFWWRQAFLTCVEPSGPRKRYLSVKLVAEPARILLWLVHGERIVRRKEVLERALRLMPEEEPSARLALATLDRLPDAEEPPLEDALRSLVRQSNRVAELLLRETSDVGSTQVRLMGTSGEPGTESPALPLTDWRARAVPAPLEPDETFAPAPGDPTQARTLAAAATAGVAGPYPALRSGHLLVLATSDWMRARLRGVQCGVTDPVSFALLAGRDVAEFPNAPGWSVHDSAARAVAEHRRWLEDDADGSGPTGERLARLLAAARAAQLWTSVREGEPTLPLTLADAGRLLAATDSGVRPVAEQACGEYEAYRLERRTPSAATVAALRREVLRLPAYGGRSPMGGRAQARH